MKETPIIARMHKDGTVVEILLDGNEQPLSRQPMRPMTQEEIVAAAFTDPDAIPMTEEQLKTACRVSRVKIMRHGVK